MKRRIPFDEQYEHIRKELRSGDKTILQIKKFPLSRKTLEVRLKEMLSCGEIVVTGRVKRIGRSGTSMRIYALNDGTFRKAGNFSVDVSATTIRLLDACHAAGVRAARGWE